MKTLIRKQLEARKAKAVRFTRNVLDDPERAGEIEDEPLEDYPARRHIKIVNREGAKPMAVRTRHALLDTPLSSKRACAGSWPGTFQNEVARCRLQPSQALKTETLDAPSATIRLFHKPGLSG